MLEECQKGGLKESATSQGDITVDKFEDKKSNVISCSSPPPSMRSKKHFQIGGGDRWWDMKTIGTSIPHPSKPREHDIQSHVNLSKHTKLWVLGH